jgi:hypothetical protein
LDRNNEIAQLLKRYFGDYNFLGPKPWCYHTDKLKCCHGKKKECNVRERKEPIWTPRFGDDNTRVMIVAEAPSKMAGLGATRRWPALWVFGGSQKSSLQAKRLRQGELQNYSVFHRPSEMWGG